MEITQFKSGLDRLYSRYNKRRFVHPDPLEFLYDYPDTRDREIVGLVASSLAYGKVAQILKSVNAVLRLLTDRPSIFLESCNQKTLLALFRGFRHRFTTGEDIAALLSGVKEVIREYGSLEECMARGVGEPTIISALSSFVQSIRIRGQRVPPFLLPDPGDGSACKRPFLYLRWMVRSDDVDPGGWKRIDPSTLIIPLDTHMYSISRKLGITTRKQADLKTAQEVTAFFRKLSPHDPVKYDFVLTRFGIRDDMDKDSLVTHLNFS